MNRQVAKRIVSFLRVSESSLTQDLCSANLDQWTSKKTVRWLDASGLTLAFWNRLKECGGDAGISPQIRLQFEDNLASHRKRVAAMRREFDLINRCLESADVKYAVLKGFAMIPEYCRDPVLRNSYDYDYLVRPDELPKTRDALRNAGFALKKEYEHRVVYFRPALAARMAASRADLYSPAFGREIEIHKNLWDGESLKIRLNVLEDTLDHRVLRGWESSYFYALTDEDHLLFQVLHAFWHILDNWCRLSWLLEIASFLDRRYEDSAFWATFSKRTQSDRRLPEIAGVVFALAIGLFGGRSAPLVSELLGSERSASLALWVNLYGTESALDNFSVNKFSLFLHRELVEDRTDWRHVRRIRLFPLRRPNRAVDASSAQPFARASAAWRQGIHVGRRMLHHLTTALQYAWEVPRWAKLRAGVRPIAGD